MVSPGTFLTLSLVSRNRVIGVIPKFFRRYESRSHKDIFCIDNNSLKVNREYLGGTTPAPPLTTCFPLGQRRDYDVHLSDHPESMVRLEKASAHAYQQAMYLTVGIGALLLGMYKGVACGK